MVGGFPFSSRVVLSRAPDLVADETFVVADVFHMLDWG